MTGRPTWQKVKGTLIHRCALAAAGKWLTIRDASRTDRLSGTPEPHLVAEARWLARRLSTALTERDDETAWSLIDSGGPRWAAAYDDYLALSKAAQAKAVADLERLATVTAAALLRMARRDDWDAILTEAIDPYAYLLAETKGSRREANQRIDLLARRDGRPPVIVDLKTGEEPATDETAGRHAVSVADKYGHVAATIIGGPVVCRALYVTFDGETSWSGPVTARERRRRYDALA